MQSNAIDRNSGGMTGLLAWMRRVVARRLRKSSTGLMQERINPLWNIDARHAQNIYDYARAGNFAQLQYLFSEVEACDPTLLTCVTRRKSALAELGWQVVRNDQRLNRNVDKTLVREQIEFLETAIARIDNLPDAVERLALAPFRGFAHVSPVHSFVGGHDVNHFDLIDNWNMCYDRAARKWLWNGDGSSFQNPSEMNSALKPIPSDELVTVCEDVSIDWPAVKIYLRSAIGERDWGRFIETYGMPPVIITMPEFTSQDDQNAYMEAAETVAEGGSGFVPYGSEVSYAEGSRGTEPFSAFIEHNQKLLVLMATGGTLTSLSEAGSGTLAGNAQMDVWQQIVRRDVRKVGNALNKQLCERLVKQAFKGKPVLVEFKFDTNPQPDPEKILQLAGLANNADFEMDAAELTQATGFTIRKKPHDGGGMGFNSQPPPTTPMPPETPPAEQTGNGVEKDQPIVENDAETTKAEEPSKTPLQGVAREKVKPHDETTTTAPRADFAANNGAEALVRSLQDDFKVVADKIAAVIAIPDDQRGKAASDLIAELNTLVPDDPAMADVIAAEMQKAFDKQIAEQPDGDKPTENAEVKN